MFSNEKFLYRLSFVSLETQCLISEPRQMGNEEEQYSVRECCSSYAGFVRHNCAYVQIGEEY